MAKDKNLLARSGYTDATDDDYIREFGLDPNKDINQQMFDLAEQQNIQAYVEKGMAHDRAVHEARKRKHKAMSMAKDQLGL